MPLNQAQPEVMPLRPSWRPTVSSDHANVTLLTCVIRCASVPLLVLYVREGSKVEAWIEVPAGQVAVSRGDFARVEAAQAWAVQEAQALLSEGHRVAQTVPIGYPRRLGAALGGRCEPATEHNRSPVL